MNDVSIRRVSDLIKDIENKTLILAPNFQRRLVWTNVDKDFFLETVSLGLPFPEIFIATGNINTKSLERVNLLVDGQQRISTLREYIASSENLVLKKVVPYAELTESQKIDFLGYKIAVRDLGDITNEQIKEIFARINSTDYSLKAMEKLNAQFSGQFKEFCDSLSRDPFFDRHNVFSMADVRRMRDLDFCVILVTTVLSTYYHRDSMNREYLQRYNDEFPQADEVTAGLQKTFTFIESCTFDKKCRVWKKTDLFTLIVELYALLTKKKTLDPASVKAHLVDFYAQVDEIFSKNTSPDDLEKLAPSSDAVKYLKAAIKATNDKYTRVERAEVVKMLLEHTLSAKPKKATTKKSAK